SFRVKHLASIIGASVYRGHIAHYHYLTAPISIAACTQVRPAPRPRSLRESFRRRRGRRRGSNGPMSRGSSTMDDITDVIDRHQQHEEEQRPHADQVDQRLALRADALATP